MLIIHNKKKGGKVVKRKTKARRGVEKDDLKGGVCGLWSRMPTQGQRRPGSWFNIQNE